MNTRRALRPAALLASGLAATLLDAQTAKPVAPPAPTAAETVQIDPLTVEAAREADDVAAALHRQMVAPAIVSVLATAELGPQPDSNPGEFLKSLPGIDVEAIAPGYRRFAVHGFGPEYLEVLFDGLPLANIHAERTSRRLDASLVSAADIAFIEFRKLPLPSDSANALGGTIDLVPRSALETGRRRVSWQASARADAETLTASPQRVPGGPRMARWRPNWQFSWTEPVRPDFGFSVALGRDELLLNQRFSAPSWSLGSAAANTAAEQAIAAGQPLPAAVSLFNPALAGAIVLDAPQYQQKTYATARVDWRPRPALKLQAGLGRHDSTQRDMQTRYQLTAGPGSGAGLTRGHGATHTFGAPGGGSARHNGQLWRDQSHVTTSAQLAATWTRDAWTLHAKAGWSKADFEFTDTGDGYFNSATIAPVPGLIDIPATGVGAQTANPIPLMVDLRHGYRGVTDAEAWTTVGGQPSTRATDYTVPVDWRSAAVARIGGARSRPGWAEETVASARVFAKRMFAAAAAPTSVQLGLDWSERSRDRRYDYHAWRFVGADGVPGSADDTAALIGGGPASARRDPFSGFSGVEAISMSELHRLYREHPAWFRYDAARSERLSLITDQAYDVEETTTAPYMEFATQAMRRRLRLTGGVRYERVDAAARGLRIDNNAAYLRYSDGSAVRFDDEHPSSPGPGGRLVVNLGTATAVNYVLVNGPGLLPAKRAGAPVFSAEVQAAGNAARAAGETFDTGTNLGRGTLAHTRAAYRAKGATNAAVGDGWFPSLHASFDVSERLLLQAGYARTQGRLDYVTALLPNSFVSDELVTVGNGAGAIGQITVQSPNLRPWTADSVEARLAWNLERGFVAFGVFRKDVRNFQPQIDTRPLSAAELADFAQRFPDAGLGPEYEGYSVRHKANAGAARVDGAEIEFRAPLGVWFPGWARGFEASGTATYLNRGGPNGGELGLNRAWMGSANLRHIAGPLTIRLGYRFNGEQLLNAAIVSNNRSGRAVREAQHLVDATLEYALRRGVRLFVTGTNLTREPTVDEQRFREKPAYANLALMHNTGATWVIGVTGAF